MRLIIIGCDGTALNIIEQINDATLSFQYQDSLMGIMIDSFPLGTLIANIPVIGRPSEAQKFVEEQDIGFLYALYHPQKMKERTALLASYNIPLSRFANFVHPHSYFAKSATMGYGNIILSNSTIQSNVTIGNFNIINSNVTVEHDTNIGDNNFVAAGCILGAGIRIGQRNFIGLNSSIRENVVLDEDVFVGMHSLVTNNFSNCKIWGTPATERV
jgi:acetyltransferase EpsM